MCKIRKIFHGLCSAPCRKKRKWLPPPLRKLSQGKVDKTQSPTPLDRPPLKKTGSDKRIKVAHYGTEINFPQIILSGHLLL
ncbi:hypothetical protein HHI36_019001 [Cryptolaemus montrouzieri]|uniref:Uncharacterized protein n=1 Tax=Cryptolaemus montrouzieri TaxID=559131 RepID=A0ABD2P1M8_9CUCU